MRGDALVQNQRLLTQAVMGLADDLESAVALQVTGITIAKLPSPAALGMIACVSDASNISSIGGILTGGGTAKALVWYNGTNWTVIGL